MPATLFDIQKKYGESVYPLYKDQMHEPYMENDTGTGYSGVVLYDEIVDKIRCDECGNWFSSLSAHLRLKHGDTVREYKEKHEILIGTPLCSQKYSAARSLVALKNVELGKFKPPYITKRFRSSKERSELAIVARKKLQFKNAHGLCPAQIVARLILARDMLDKETVAEVKMADLQKVDVSLYSALMRKYSSVEQAAKELDLTFTDGKKYDDTELLAGLRNFVLEYKRIPSKRDFDEQLKTNTLASSGTYRESFGSWNRAKELAGLELMARDLGLKHTKTRTPGEPYIDEEGAVGLILDGISLSEVAKKYDVTNTCIGQIFKKRMGKTITEMGLAKR